MNFLVAKFRVFGFYIKKYIKQERERRGMWGRIRVYNVKYYVAKTRIFWIPYIKIHNT